MRSGNTETFRVDLTHDRAHCVIATLAIAGPTIAAAASKHAQAIHGLNLAHGNQPMMLSELLATDRILCGADITSKKKSLQKLAELLSADPEIADRTVYDRLCARERLGSTGLGAAIAIPHGRVPDLTTPRAALLTLDEGIDFDAIDDQSVDLLVGLLVPEEAAEAHLQILANLASQLSDKQLCSAIRSASSPEAVLELLAQNPPADSAASG